MGYAEQLIQQGIEIGERRGVEIGERRGLERGEHNGRVAQVVELLTDRFGPLPSWAFEHLQGADNDELRRVVRAHLGAPSLESLLERSS
ncbi:MAG: hypothetical protein IPN01_04235 [Deltaproteobacteria bacterium]|nr:hypothetical protein [Deltaproteobacteria bacterium]